LTCDGLGQLVSVTDPRNNTTTFTYTSAGLLASVTDALNNTTSYVYDARGNRTSVTRSGHGTSGPARPHRSRRLRVPPRASRLVNGRQSAVVPTQAAEVC